MERVLRYKLDVGDNKIEMPAGSKVLSVAIKPGDDVISLWVLYSGTLDAQTMMETRTFRVVGTGREVDLYTAQFIGTALFTGPGAPVLCWHVFAL